VVRGRKLRCISDAVCGVSVLDLQHDVYYGLYFAATLAMLAAYVRWEHVDVRALFARNWIWTRPSAA
jgi:hypothetical protein